MRAARDSMNRFFVFGGAVAVLLSPPPATGANPQVSAGWGGSAALHQSGAVLLWGSTPTGFPLAPQVLDSSRDAVAIASGGSFVLIVKADGSAWSAGGNALGQLGDGTREYRQQAVRIGLPGRVRSVSTSGSSSYALLDEGTVWAWGSNASGQLGDGTTIDRLTPVRVQGLSDIVAISTGGWGSASALRRDGSVWAWGENGTGNLGDGTHIARPIPVQVLGLDSVVSHCTAGGHSLALRADGSVWAWGWNLYGQLASSVLDNLDRATPIVGVGSVAAVACGGNQSFLLRVDGTLLAFGSNGNGSLGLGNGAGSQVAQPTPVPGLPSIAAVSTSLLHSLAMARDGSVFAWGGNEFGQIGDGTLQARPGPVRVLGPGGIGQLNLTGLLPSTINQLPTAHFSITPVSGTVPFTLSLDGSGNTDGDGAIASWTWTVSSGETATGARAAISITRPGIHTVRLVTTDNAGGRSMGQATFDAHAGALNVSPMVSLGGGTSFALRQDGTVWGWGQTASLALRQPSLTGNKQVFPLSIGLTGITSISAGWFLHVLAVDQDGGVWGWGFNTSGELGAGTATPFETLPIRAAISNVAAAAAGLKFSLFLKRDGTVWAAGFNGEGLLGNGTQIDSPTPVRVPGLTDIVAISAGMEHALALGRDGRVWAWGRNRSGPLGDGSTASRLVPVRIDLDNVVRISAGANHSLAVRSDGSVFAWGGNWEGQLGDNTRETRLFPTRVPGITAVDVAAGGNHSLALGADGRVLGWGSNCYDNASFCEPSGQVGNGTAQSQLVPQAIALDRVVGIAASYMASAAHRADGTVWMWGRNADGQLGEGTLANRYAPHVVLGPQGAGFFDLLPAVANEVPSTGTPVFGIIASDTGSESVRSVTARVRYREQDVGTSASTFVFALAPATAVQGAAALKEADPRVAWKARNADGKSSHVQCALAQLNAQGQLVAVSAQSLQAYVSGVLSAQGQAVTLLNGIPAANIQGATFYVGYGANGNAMLLNGTTRSAVTVSGKLSCQPQAPQTGWWWNAAEGGRGYSIEARGTRLFFAAFHYDAAGRPTWNFAGGATSLDGSLFTSDFLSASGGQTLTGTYRLPGLANAGAITLAFSDATHGTMLWPGGAVAIERQPIVPAGLTAPAQAGLPEGGWWWNPQESGRGFFIEWQNGWVDIAGYMYDASGNPTWYIAAYPTPNPMLITGNWWTFGGGQAMGGAYRPATRTSDNVGALRVEFTGPTTATMQLPDGRRVPIVRQEF